MLAGRGASANSLFLSVVALSSLSASTAAPFVVDRPSPSFAGIMPRNRATTRSMTRSSSSSHTDILTDHNFSCDKAVEQKKNDPTLPTMIVFDLDDCLWSPEMHTLHAKPSIPEEGDLGLSSMGNAKARGIVGMKVPPAGPTVRLFPGARKALVELATNPRYAGVILAAASSSLEPSFSYTCLENIEILPGLPLRQMIRYDQIGRTGPLTPDKRTHFRLLHEESQVPYEEMLFFDDCNWGDHCAIVSREFGVVSQRTPYGIQYSEFEEAIDKYRSLAEQRAAEGH